MVAIAILIVAITMLAKYKLVCEVTVGEQTLGYVANKENFEKAVSNIIDEEEDNKLYTEIKEMPAYNLVFVAKSEETKDEEILAKIEDSATTTYKLYAVTVDGKQKATVSNLDEAEELVKDLKKKYDDTIKPTIAIQDVIATDNEKEVSSIKTAKTKITKELDKKVEKAEAEEEAKEAEKAAEEVAKAATTTKVASLNGVKLTVKPVSGTITSRFGNRESIRSYGHTGLDIAAPAGTPIKVAASGTVIFSGYSGGYGNVVKVSHGSGIVTYYAHCSKLYVKTGEKVSAGDKIAAVGSTGNSTGNHLHFEVVKNGVELNPQNYLY